jgi:hypothetical protein
MVVKRVVRIWEEHSSMRVYGRDKVGYMLGQEGRWRNDKEKRQNPAICLSLGRLHWMLLTPAIIAL